MKEKYTLVVFALIASIISLSAIICCKIISRNGRYQYIKSEYSDRIFDTSTGEWQQANKLLKK